MVKSASAVMEKMKDRIATGGKYLKTAMTEAPDPVDVLLKDPDKYARKLADGVNEAIRTGSYAAGLQVAKGRNAWKGAVDRAGRHYEERTDDIVSRAMESYDKRKAAIEAAQAAVKDMPTTTRAQRIAKSAKYQEAVGKAMDAAFGRKA